MPAASWRTNPARTMSLWLTASASAGSSRSVGMSERVQRMKLLRTRDLVGPGHARIVDQPLDRDAAQNMRLEDLLEVGLFHSRVPDVLGIDDHHRAVPALREAAGLVDADLRLLAGRRRTGPQHLDELFDVSLSRTGLA